MILDKTSYSKAIEEILHDNTMLSNLDIPVGQDINYMTNLAKRITSDLKLLKMKKLLKRLLIRTTDYLSLDEVLIRVTKSSQRGQEWTTTFPSNFVCYWYTYLQPREILNTVFKTFTWKEYIATDLFHIAEDICKRDTNSYMAGLHVDFLFTIIPLDETIDICINN